MGLDCRKGVGALGSVWLGQWGGSEVRVPDGPDVRGLKGPAWRQQGAVEGWQGPVTSRH